MSQSWNIFLGVLYQTGNRDDEGDEPEEEPKTRTEKLNLLEGEEINDEADYAEGQGETSGTKRDNTLVGIGELVARHDAASCPANHEQGKDDEQGGSKDRAECGRRKVEPEGGLEEGAEIHSKVNGG